MVRAFGFVQLPLPPPRRNLTVFHEVVERKLHHRLAEHIPRIQILKRRRLNADYLVYLDAYRSIVAVKHILLYIQKYPVHYF